VLGCSRARRCRATLQLGRDGDDGVDSVGTGEGGEKEQRVGMKHVLIWANPKRPNFFSNRLSDVHLALSGQP
jgi:hypothetical protein